MRELYPPVEPYAVHPLDVGGGHSVYVEECGNPAGIPAIFLHGGPGGGCKIYQRSFFDPTKYRAVLFDQRGCGRSKPHGLLEHNKTWDLLADMETIRERLGIEKWLLFGGSWGSALALLYAQQYPERVSGIVSRGTFLARQADLDWYIKDGVNRIYPERWAELQDTLHNSKAQNGSGGAEDLIAAFHHILHGPDELAQRRAARAWSVWGGQVALGEDFTLSDPEGHVPAHVLHQARIELHYGFHRYFVEENQILRDCPLIPKVPVILIHGRRDLVCPVEAAYTLQKHLPFAELRVLPTAGHIASNPEMTSALVQAADDLAGRLSA
jgi:proline iminopeptidase